MRVLEELRRSLWLQARVVLLLMLSASCGCLTTATTTQLPLEYQFTREPLIIYSNFSLPRRHRLFNELVSRRDDVTEILGLPPSDEPIHIYLFDSFENYQTPLLCNGALTTVDVLINGGVGPYTILWNDGNSDLQRVTAK